MVNPINPSIAIIVIKINAATMLIANDFSHPESKKCFTNADQINNTIIEAIKP